jgi:hypothetical protein
VLVEASASSFVVSSVDAEAGTGHWQVRPAPQGMSSLTCPSQKLCIGVANSSIEVTRHPREGARAWRAVAFKAPFGFGPRAAVACHGTRAS